ncbi:ATP-binding protein [Bacillaceae bacterium S4-13-56]
MRNYINRLRIRNKVLLFGLIMSTLPLIFLSVFLFLEFMDDQEKSVKERQTIIIESIAKDVDQQIQQIIKHVQFLSTVDGLEDHRGLYYQTLHENQAIEEIVMFDHLGVVKDRVSRFDLNRVQNQDWMNTEQLDQLSHEKIFIDEVSFNSFGQPIMKLATSLPLKENNQFLGGIGVVIQLQKIIGEITSSRVKEEGILYLLDQKDKIIAHQDYSQLWKPSEENNEGDRVLGVQKKIDTLGWTLVMEQPYKEAYSSVYTLASKGTIIVLIVGFFISLLSIAAGLYFTRPIESLQKAIKSFQKNQWVEPVRLQRADEMGQLANAFNEMSAELYEKSQSLLMEKERLDVIVDGIGAGLALVRSDFTISWINPTLESWLDRFELNIPCYVLFSGEDQPCKDCPIMDPAQPIESNEIHKVIGKSGKKKIFRHRVYPLTQTVDSNEHYLIVMEDITEQQEMEEKLIQTDKLSALGLMASSFAHEVNNPLATINVYAEDLLDRLKEEKEELVQSGEMEKYLRIIKENTERCKNITRNLLNFSRKTEWTKNNIDVNEVVHNSIALIHYTFSRKNINLELMLTPNLPPLIGDGLKLMQVMVNMIQNAVDAMENGGDLLVSSTLERESIALVVKDTGCGMSEETIGKVFDPFYTTKPVGKGTGLGLSVCYGIIQQFGGEIHIESEIGKGTVVKIQLPILKGEEENNA